MNLKTKVVMAASATVLGAALIGGSTLALFTSSAASSNNNFAAGTLNITLDKQDPSGNAYFSVSNMAPGDSEIRPVTISSTGSLQLKYNLSLAVGGFLGTHGADHLTIAAYPTQQDAQDGTNAIDQAAPRILDALSGPHHQDTIFVKLTLPLGANDEYQGQSGTASISVNAVQTSNLAPHAIPFTYTDISNNGGTYIPGSNADDEGFAIDLPFTLNFYGQSFTRLYANTNGLVTFNGATWEYNNGPMAQAPDNSIAAFWDDLNRGAMYYACYTVDSNAPDPFILIQWKDSQHYYSSPTAVNFQTKIYKSGKVQMFYQSTQFGLPRMDNGASATVGIKKNGANVQQYSFNQPIITNGTAIEFIAQ